MTDNDIIKALECCIVCNQNQFADCNKCPLGRFYPECDTEIEVMCLDLINRLKAEIERLKKVNNDLNCQVNACNPIQTIKDFAAYLCDGRVSNDPVVIAVKCAVKEMTEGEDESVVG